MTPNDLDVLIHYYTSGAVHPRHNAPAVRESINKFLDDGIFEEASGGEYIVTLKGNAFVKRILQVEYPILIWAYESEDE